MLPSFSEGSFCIKIMFQNHSFIPWIHIRSNLFNRTGGKCLIPIVNQIYITLGILMLSPTVGQGRTFWLSQIDNSWIISFGTVDRTGPKTHDKPQHSAGSIQRIAPAIGAVGISDACSIGHQKIFVHGTGYTLNQKSHLFILITKPALFPVFQCRQIHGTGIYGADSIFQFRQTLGDITSVNAEDRFIFSGKCISKTVFLKTAGADNDRALPKIF